MQPTQKTRPYYITLNKTSKTYENTIIGEIARTFRTSTTHPKNRRKNPKPKPNGPNRIYNIVPAKCSGSSKLGQRVIVDVVFPHFASFVFSIGFQLRTLWNRLVNMPLAWRPALIYSRKKLSSSADFPETIPLLEARYLLLFPCCGVGSGVWGSRAD